MVIELARLFVDPGRDREFLAAYAEAWKVIARQPGCRAVELRRCVEKAADFLLFVHWDTLEDHMVGFRNSADFSVWRSLVTPFFREPPHVEHFAEV